jgi:hypothetical protein
MGLNGPDERRTQKPPGSHSAPDFEKASGLRKNNASGVQRHFEAANGQIFLPELPAPSTEIMEKLLALPLKSTEGPRKCSAETQNREV